MRRKDIRIALLLSIVLLIASPVALTTDVPRDSAITITSDAGYEYENARGTTPAKGDLNHDGAITQADAVIGARSGGGRHYAYSGCYTAAPAIRHFSSNFFRREMIPMIQQTLVSSKI